MIYKLAELDFQKYIIVGTKIFENPQGELERILGHQTHI